MLAWTEKYATGDPVIDLQHQTLIDYINRLEGISRTTNFDRTEAEFVLHLVDFVENYTVTHFQHEEGCMGRHRCPAQAENKVAHARFLAFFEDFKRRFASEGGRPELLGQLHQTCSEWIHEHILGVDLQLKPCLRRNAGETTPGT